MIKVHVRNILLLSLLMSCLPLAAIGEAQSPEPEMHIQSMFERSQVVVLGKVAAVRVLNEQKTYDSRRSQSLPQSIETREALIDVLQTYKGEQASTVRVNFTVEAPPTSVLHGAVLAEGEVALLFLALADNGTYNLADPKWGKYRLDGFAPLGVGGSGLDQLEKDLDSAISENNPSLPNVFELLKTFGSVSPVTEEKLDSLTHNSNPLYAAGAFAVLLTTKKPQYYANLGQFLRLHGSEIPPEQLMTIYGRIQDPGSAADARVFDELSNLPLPVIKLGAMFSIRKLKSPYSVPTLISHLSDSDPTIEYLAVITLNEIVGNGSNFGPSMPQFDKNPQNFISLWQRWWETTGINQYSR